MQYLKFGISISIISWMVGMAVHALIKNRPLYANLSNFNFIRSKRINKWLGVGVFKWVVKNTVFKFFNQSLKVETKVGLPELEALRKEMTTAEVGHLIGFGFGFVLVFAAEKVASGDYLFGLTIMGLNALPNLHPSLLQQQNKRRLDRLIERYRRRVLAADGRGSARPATETGLLPKK